jgi:formylglycine-generating enzyme required for sulfatase activity
VFVVRVALVAASLALAACGRGELLAPGASGGTARPGPTGTDQVDALDPVHADVCGKSLRGPEMLALGVLGGGSFCIDSTEVTRRQYAAFLASGPPLDAQPPYCAFNDSFVPWIWDEQSADEVPVRALGWCDANAYCAWAGKRLCGRIGGGVVPLAEINDPMKDEWVYACTSAGQHTFPYGDTYEGTWCVTAGYDAQPAYAQGPRPVRSAPRCVGGWPGLYDMSGNANEWENSGDQITGASDTVVARGGGYGDDAAFATCTGGVNSTRDGADEGNGFRCCKDGPG